MLLLTCLLLLFFLLHFPGCLEIMPNAQGGCWLRAGGALVVPIYIMTLNDSTASLCSKHTVTVSAPSL